MKSLALAFPVLLLASALCAQNVPAQISAIPVVANAAGANGTFWRTDLFLSNPSRKTAIDVTVVLGKEGDQGQRTYRLAPSETRVLPNVLETEFSYSGVGGLFMYASEEPGLFGARARVYTETSCGSFGQFVEAQPATGPFSGNELEFRVRPEERLNVGFFARFGYPADSNLSLVVVDDSGTPVAAITFGAVPDLFHFQTSLSAILPATVASGRVRLKVDSRVLPYCDWAIPYLSSVDNASGSAEFWALNQEYLCEIRAAEPVVEADARQ